MPHSEMKVRCYIPCPDGRRNATEWFIISRMVKKSSNLDGVDSFLVNPLREVVGYQAGFGFSYERQRPIPCWLLELGSQVIWLRPEFSFLFLPYLRRNHGPVTTTFLYCWSAYPYESLTVWRDNDMHGSGHCPLVVQLVRGPVLDEAGRYLGFVSEFDLLKALDHSQDLKKVTTQQIMSKEPYLIHNDTTIKEAIRIMKEKKLLNPLCRRKWSGHENLYPARSSARVTWCGSRH